MIHPFVFFFFNISSNVIWLSKHKLSSSSSSYWRLVCALGKTPNRMWSLCNFKTKFQELQPEIYRLVSLVIAC
uniref:Uncharacterized protein n=1 Tax=Brassica oleracea var. oleracea TaxID=109376 RepID=A0A0D3BQK3_BRAOL